MCSLNLIDENVNFLQINLYTINFNKIYSTFILGTGKTPWSLWERKKFFQKTKNLKNKTKCVADEWRVHSKRY